MTDEQGKLYQILKLNNNDIDSLRQERDALKAELEFISNQIVEKGNHVVTSVTTDNLEDSTMQHLRVQIDEWRTKTIELERKLHEQEGLIGRLEKELSHFRSDAQNMSAERVRDSLSVEKERNLTLENELARSKNDFALLSVEWANMDSLLKSPVSFFLPLKSLCSVAVMDFTPIDVR